MKNCEKIMESFFLLDKNEHLPLLMTMHLLFCKKCRSQIRLFSLVEKNLSAPLYIAVPISKSITNSIMLKLNINQKSEKNHGVSLFNWVLGGILMIVAFLIFVILQKNKYFLSDTFIAIFYVIFGCYLTAYCGLFVGSNLDFFVKKISLIHFVHQAK
ncbi:MAG: hypothetical protein ACRC5H_09905 [Treponemataceae bacterium]